MKMKCIIIAVLTAGLITGCQSTKQLKPISQIKPGASKEGSIANAKLIADTTNAFKKIPGAPTISPETKILKFVIQQPVGNPGSRAWREIWVINPHANPKQYMITFRESGLNAADFEIRPMYKE